MDAQLKQIQVKPATYDKDGGITKEEYATLTVNIPMDSAGQREGVVDLLSLLSREFIHIEVSATGQVHQ